MIGIIRSNSEYIRRYLSVALAAIAILATCVTAVAQKPEVPNPIKPKTRAAEKAAPAAPMPVGTHELTASDIEAFLDGIVPLQLAREDIAGATVSVVKDGKVIFAKGYGFADVSKRTPVVAEQTLFRPGSISKLFTWTAVMQLVEQGKLDLDRDVNEYLDFKIPATFSQPLTLRNIMTHTPGFEEVVKDLIVADVKEPINIEVYLKSHLPKQIYPPGTTPAYSNYATALAGYIVQRVSGEAFDDYIENHILKPLTMNSTTFRQPLPDRFKGRMSNGYIVASAPAAKFELVVASPAGACSTTATDMARFMLAHLQNGELDGTHILKPETAQLMHSRQFENLRDMNGMALGFYEESRNGHRIFGHGGDTNYFHSDLHLIPDVNFGFYVSYNSGGKGENRPRTSLWEGVLDRYFPYTPPATAPLGTAAQDASAVTGNYVASRRADTTIVKVFNVITQLRVTANADNTISVSEFKDLSGQLKKFEEVSPLLFRETHGQDLVGFKRDNDGRMILVWDFPAIVFLRTSFTQSSRTNMALIIGAMLILLAALIVWPVSSLVRSHYGIKNSLDPMDRRLWIWSRITCLVLLIFLISYAVFFTTAGKDLSLLTPSSDPLLRVIQLVGWLGVLGTVVAFYNAIRAWQTPTRWLWSKIGETAVCVACLACVWFAYYWNLLHLSLKY